MDRGLFFLFMLIPALAPMSLTSQRAWVSASTVILSFFVLIWLLLEIRRKNRPYIRVPGISLWALFCGFALLQMIPLPPWLIKLLSYHTYNLYDHSIWVVSPGKWMPLTVQTKATLLEFFKLCAMGAFYVSAVQILIWPEIQRKVISFLCFLAGLHALVNFFYPIQAGDDSGYVAFSSIGVSGALGLLMPLLLAFLLANKPRVQYQTFAEKIRDLPRAPETKRLLLINLALMLTVSAIVIRAPWYVGGIAFLAAMFLGLTLALRRTSRSRGVWVMLSAILVLLAAGGWGRVAFKELPAFWQLFGFGPGGDPAATVALFQKFPLVGSGMGTFSLVAAGRISGHLEMTPFQEPSAELITWAVEAGMVGSVLACAFALVVIRSIWVSWRSCRSSASIYLSMGAMAGFFSGLFLCLSSFGNSMLWVLLLAIAVAAAHSRSRGKATRLSKDHAPRVYRIASVLMVLLGASLIFYLGVLGAQFNLPPHIQSADSQGRGSQGALEDVDPLLKAAKLDPLEEKYHYELGRIFSAGIRLPDALSHYSKAIGLAPLSGAICEDLGLLLTTLGDDYQAQKLLSAAADNDYWNADRHLTFAHWLFVRQHNKEGLEQISQAMSIAPHKTGEFLAMLAYYGFSVESMEETLPPKALSQVAFGEYVLKNQLDYEVDRVFNKALEVATRADRSDSETFLRIFDYYADRARYEKALSVAHAGLAKWPEETALLRAAAMAYESMGVTYRAVEEYRKALVLDPKDQQSRLRLEQLSNR